VQYLFYLAFSLLSLHFINFSFHFFVLCSLIPYFLIHMIHSFSTFYSFCSFLLNSSSSFSFNSNFCFFLSPFLLPPFGSSSLFSSSECSPDYANVTPRVKALQVKTEQLIRSKCTVPIAFTKTGLHDKGRLPTVQKRVTGVI